MIDLCKIFGVEEGEEFKLRGWDTGKGFIYKIKDNTLLFRRENDTEIHSGMCMGINDIKKIKEVIKLPKKKEFTDDELCILRNMDKDIKWIARDKDKNLFAYEDEPRKTVNDKWYDTPYNDLRLFNHLFKSIKWSDEEPVFIDDYVERGVE